MNINPSYNSPSTLSAHADKVRNSFFSDKYKKTDTLISAARSATEQAEKSGLRVRKSLYPTKKILAKRGISSFLPANVSAISKAFNHDHDLTNPDTFNFHGGCCYGLSACYILFNMLGRSDIFNQLLNVLEQNPRQGWFFYRKHYKTLAEAITDAGRKDRNSQTTDDDTQLLLNLRPFLEMLAAIQSPHQTELRKDVFTQNMQQVISYISTGNLNDNSIISSSHLCITGLKTSGLKQLLASLSTGINRDVPERFFTIYSAKHVVVIKVTLNGYELFNTNQKYYQKSFSPGMEDELASTLQEAIHPNSPEKNSPHNDILFVIKELYPPSNHEYLQQNKHSLQSLCSNIPSKYLTDINHVCPYSKATQLYFALIHAGNEALKRILKHEKLNINAPCNYATKGNRARLYTALHIAAISGNTEAINLLLDAGADAAKLARDGATPLHLAMYYERVPAIEVLLKKVPELVNIPCNGMSPLFSACKRGNIQIIKILLSMENIDVNQVEPDGKTPLYAACMAGSTQIVRTLLSAENFDVNQTGPYGMTPLYKACMKGYLEIVKLLLSKENIRVNQVGPLGMSPLHQACMNRDAKMVKILLSAENINVNQAGPYGMTPLYMACMTGNIEIVKLLLSAKNIDINLKDSKGRSSAFIAWQKGHTKIFNLLKERGAVIDS